MIRWAIVDAGPLVAHVDANDAWHEWTVARLRELPMPLLVCEPVVAEASYLVRRHPAAVDRLLGYLADGTWRIGLTLEQEIAAVRLLHRKYADQPMSLADACVVRMAELFDDHAVLTLDRDFAVYRKHGDRPIPLIAPFV